MAKELLFSITKKDLEITYFAGTGAGGQHRNKHKNCVRIKHSTSGAAAIGTEQRSLAQNKKMAFIRLTESAKFKSWLKVEASRVAMGKDEWEKQKEKWVDDMMKEENLKVEYFTPK